MVLGGAPAPFVEEAVREQKRHGGGCLGAQFAQLFEPRDGLGSLDFVGTGRMRLQFLKNLFDAGL